MKQQHTLQPKVRFPEFEGDWEKKGLKDIGTINRGKSKHRPRNDKRLYGGDIPFIQTGDVNNDKLYITEYTQTYTDFGLNQSKLWDENTLCITIAANIANTSILKFKSCFPDSLIGFIPNDQSDIIFVKYTFDKIREELKKLSQGVAQDNLNLEKLNSISTLIPSLPEQQKIADYLSTIDAKINLLEEKKAQLALYKKAMMQKLFSQEIRFKPSEAEALEAYPEWEEKRLKEISEFRRGSFPQPYGLAKWYDDENGYPFVQVYDVDDNFKLKQNTKRKISSLATKSSVFVKKGTLLITIQGSIGRIAITEFDCYVDRTLLIITSLDIKLHIDYYKYCLFLLFEIEKHKAPGGTIKTITKEVLSDFVIPFPCLPEQQKIADFLSAIDESIEKVTEQMSQMQSFKKAMLQGMFV